MSIKKHVFRDANAPMAWAKKTDEFEKKLFVKKVEQN